MRKLNEGWRGLNTVKLIDNGAYSDPELQYIDEQGNKYVANYWDIEDGMYQYYKEEKDYAEKNNDKYANNLKNTFKFDESDEDFAKFLKAHEVEVIQDIIDASKSPEITEDLSKYTDDELEAELKSRKNNNARLVYLNKDEIIFDPNNEYIVNKFKEGDVLELLDDVLYADLNTSKDIVFDDSNYDDEKAIELLDAKYGLKVTNDENNEAMTYFPKGTHLIIDELNGPAGWTTFKVEGKEALDFSEPIKVKYRGNKMLKENVGLADVEAKDHGEVNQTYAAAIRDIKNAEKKKDEFTKRQAEPKHDEKPKNPTMVKGAKKLHLDESLFEDSEGNVKSKVKAFLKDKLNEFNDNLALVIHASIPEYSPDLCAEDDFYASINNLDKVELNYINALINVLFANEAK